MKRTDQILQALAVTASGLNASQIAEQLGTISQNIGKPLTELVDGQLLTSSSGRPAVFTITEAGRAHTQSPEFGREVRATPTARPAPADAPLAIGIFTTGELHVEANGKRLVLSKAQASELVEFVCSLPNKLFTSAAATPRSAGTGIASFVHRMKDE